MQWWPVGPALRGSRSRTGRLGGGRLGGDAGHTLTEVLVAMGVLSLAAALAVGGITQAYHFATHYDSLTTDQTELHTVFSRLDRTVRYASGISVPAQVNGNFYVEFGTVTGCSQLRIANAAGQLQIRSLTAGGPLGPWTVLASHVGAPAGFVRTPATFGGVPHQQLQVLLSVRSGSGEDAVGKQSSFDFVALNTSVDTASDTVCSAMDRS